MSSKLVSDAYLDRVLLNRSKILNLKSNDTNDTNDTNYTLQHPNVLLSLSISDVNINNDIIEFNKDNLKLVQWSDRHLNKNIDHHFNSKHFGEDALNILLSTFDTNFMPNKNFKDNNPNIHIIVGSNEYFARMKDVYLLNDLVNIKFQLHDNEDKIELNNNSNNIKIIIDNLPYIIEYNKYNNDNNEIDSILKNLDINLDIKLDYLFKSSNINSSTSSFINDKGYSLKFSDSFIIINEKENNLYILSKLIGVGDSGNIPITPTNINNFTSEDLEGVVGQLSLSTDFLAAYFSTMTFTCNNNNITVNGNPATTYIKDNNYLGWYLTDLGYITISKNENENIILQDDYIHGSIDVDYINGYIDVNSFKNVTQIIMTCEPLRPINT